MSTLNTSNFKTPKKYWAKPDSVEEEDFIKEKEAFNRRFIDFALESESVKIAIEIDGETYHNPNKVYPPTNNMMISQSKIALSIKTGRFTAGFITS